MEISRQEAIDLLHKWFEERTPVTALLFAADSSIKVGVTGFVNGLSDMILVSDGPRDEEMPKNFILVPGLFMKSYEYSDPGTPSVSVEYLSGVRLSIFENHSN
ncbi:MAG TPA: hypothetical protein VN037_07775 [Verrucomicrobiae bacterium]|jgi:hypothetical protein|nr:hypothetical protein [Verrucomicrobiae bacterium]